MTNSLSHYNFSVYGNPAYSRSLADNSTITKYFDITGGINHYLDCPNDDFRLNSAIFNYADDNSLMCQLSYELIGIFNSIHKVFCFEDFRRFPLRIKEFYLEDTIVTLERKDTRFWINDFSHDKIELIKNIESEILDLKDSTIFCFLLMSLIREDIYIILKYIDGIDSNSDDWSQLYKILETIENLKGITNIEIEIDDALRNKFKSSANNFSISGINSRHGFSSNLGGKRILSYDEALSFVLGIAKKYFNTLLTKINNENEVNFLRLSLGTQL